MTVRAAVLLLAATILSGPALAQQEGTPTTTAALTRCAGKVGTEARRADAAFPAFGLDGRPWMKVERSEGTVAGQTVATTITGTGWRRSRDGTSVSYRYVCMLDPAGQAVMFRAAPLQRNLGDVLPPAIVVDGAASYLERVPLPRGVELQVQLLDVTGPGPGEVVAEQVVRSGWQVPIPFALRVPKDLPLAGRKLEITARFVQAKQPLYQLQERRFLTSADLDRFMLLTLDRTKPAP